MTVGYVQRLGRIFEAIQVPDLIRVGLEISDPAAPLGCSEDEVRQDLWRTTKVPTWVRWA